jgi:uncharacterized membrane protein (UPF0127 family)
MLLLACAHQSELLELHLGDATAHVEIADTQAERAHGLMGRRALDPDTGMLFVYPDAEPHFFWMKDTPLPLSIAFLDAGGRIIRLADMQPFDTHTTPSGGPAQYALEMEQGWFRTHGIAEGSLVTGLPPGSAE